MNQPAIRVSEVSCHYGRRPSAPSELFWALSDLTFDVHEGTSLGIIGNNGAGKSTLLALLAGIISPDRGRVDCGKRTATLLSLNAGFEANLSGRDNAVLSGILLGLSRKKVRSALDQIREFSGLADFFGEPVRTYSAGMRARLGFAVAVYLEPDILLIDEVTGVGDSEFRARSSEYIQTSLKSSKTVVMVSHNLPFIRENCDKSLWLNGGKMGCFGPTDQVMAEYHQNIQAKKVAT